MDLVQVENKLKDLFTEFVKERVKARDNMDNLFNLRIFSDDFIEKMMPSEERSAELLFEHLFGEEALDWVNWWVYEKYWNECRAPLEAYHENGDIIPTDTIEDLWNLVNSTKQVERD